jgi:hypothetical protein
MAIIFSVLCSSAIGKNGKTIRESFLVNAHRRPPKPERVQAYRRVASCKCFRMLKIDYLKQALGRVSIAGCASKSSYQRQSFWRRRLPRVSIS